MIKPIRLLFLASILIAAGCASGPSGNAFDAPMGEWQTSLSWGPAMTRQIRMEIIDETRAVYEYRGGRILFTVSENLYQWEGYWVEDFAKNNLCADLKDDSNAWGSMVIEFSEAYNEFKGRWDYCGKGETFSWNGYR